MAQVLDRGRGLPAEGSVRPGDQGRGPGPRRTPAVALVLAVVVLVPFGYAFGSLWTSAGDDLDQVRSEQVAIDRLRPVLTLTAAVAALDPTSPGGSRAEGVRAGIGSVDRALADAEPGVRQRWTEVRRQLDALLDRPVTERTATAAVTTAGTAVELLRALVVELGDRSGLALGDDLATYYLADVAVRRVPTILVEGRRLVTLVGLRGPSDEARRTATAVVQGRVLEQVTALGEGVRSTLSVRQDLEEGPALVSQIDALQASVDDLSTGSPAGTPARAPSAVAARAAVDRLGTAVLEISRSSLDQARELLQRRVEDLERTRRTLLWLTLGAVAVLLATFWVARAPRRQDREGRPDAGDAGRDTPLIDVRELVEPRELVRVGRAVAPGRGSGETS